MTETRRALLDALHRHALGGAAVAVVRAGVPPELECAGIADQASERTITPQTVFRIASISKTMTAIGVLQLRDAGRLDLDDAVNKHLTSFRIEPPAGGRDVTFRDLLTHTSGIGEAPRRSDLARRAAWGWGEPGTAPADLAALYGGVLRPDTAAGSKWAYANHGFAVLGQVVEDLTGQSFGAYMREHVFDPLGMEHTEYTRTERTADEVATGHHWMFGRFRPLKDYDLALLGPGSVLSSLSDMAIYAEWLLHGGDGMRGPVLRPETLAEMMSPQFSVDLRVPGMGLAFWLDQLGEHRVAGHDGNVPGFGSSLLLAPDDGVAVLVLTNTSSAIGAHLATTELLSSLLGVDSPSTRLHNIDVVSRPNLWADLAGHYAPAPGFLTNARPWQMVGGEVQVLVKNRRLVLRALSPLPAVRHGLELHAVDEDDPLAFAVEMDGLVIPIVFAARRVWTRRQSHHRSALEHDVPSAVPAAKPSGAGPRRAGDDRCRRRRTRVAPPASQASWRLAAPVDLRRRDRRHLGRVTNSRESERMARAMDAPGSPEVRVTTASGSITVVAEPRHDVSVDERGDVRRASDGAFEVVPDKRSRSVTVRCPLGSSVAIGSRSGKLRLSGRLGAVRATALSGSISVDEASSVDLRAMSGTITVGTCTGACRIKTKSGSIRVASAGSVEIHVGSGTATVDYVAGAVTMRAVSGRVSLTSGAEGPIEAETMSGSVTVVLPAGCRPNVRAKSLSSRPHIHCPPGNDCDVTVRTMSGRITVECR